ncbi:MAG TPA: Gmad2 immunoglobulin-like domain-containing protein [Acidimicrobiales bacterium]|nr:Gmad2 immunoglobulin-like domain-containing protein [Acidimicrobiales bacterium]
MTRQRLRIAVALGILSVGAVACSSTTPNSSSTSTTVAATTSTTSPQSSTWTAVWPTAASSIRYPTPEAAAKGFATDYLHVVDPVLGPFQQGDARSGEVPVQLSPAGPVTTVLVRELGSDNSWWVLGAGTAAINLTEPVWNASIASPVTLTGTSVAFEGTVQTQVREDDSSTPLGVGYVTGGSTAMGPFSGTLAFAKATTKYGAVVLYTISAENGAVTAASVIRIRFA